MHPRRCGPAITGSEILTKGRERGIELRRSGPRRLNGEHAGSKIRTATTQHRGVVVQGLEDTEPPALIKTLAFGQQHKAGLSVLCCRMAHPDRTARRGGGSGTGSVEQRLDRQHFALIHLHRVVLSAHILSEARTRVTR